jgi:hypothetical protein
LCISEAEAGCPCSDCEHCSELGAIAGGDDCISPEDWDAYIDGQSDGGGDGGGTEFAFDDLDTDGDLCISTMGLDRRYTQAMAAAGNLEGSIFVLSGLNDGSVVWEQQVQGTWISQTTSWGPQGSGSITTYLDDFFGFTDTVTFCSASMCGGSLYAFGGGVHDTAGGKFEEKQQVPLLAWDEGWMQRPVIDTPFRNRYGHGMTATTDHIFLFGGTFGNLDNTHPNSENHDWSRDNRIVNGCPVLCGESPCSNANDCNHGQADMGVKNGEEYVKCRVSARSLFTRL